MPTEAQKAEKDTKCSAGTLAVQSCLHTHTEDRHGLEPLHSHICKSAIDESISVLVLPAFPNIMPALRIYIAAVPMATLSAWRTGCPANQTARHTVMGLELGYRYHFSPPNWHVQLPVH